MISSLRKAYNDGFTIEKYQAFLQDLDSHYPGAIQFRLAETPVFVPRSFREQMISACESIIDRVLDPNFMELTSRSIPTDDKVPGTYGYPQTIAFDFGVCTGPGGSIVPQLVEMQGFPSLYAFQDFYPGVLRQHFTIPDGFTQYLNGHDADSFRQLFKKVLLGSHAPENVVLLEIRPEQQKTLIDFYCTRDLAGVRPVCISSVIREGKNIFYLDEGEKIPIRRIYNRVIFDELHTAGLDHSLDLKEEIDVEWVPHPDWFYRISKYTLPFIDHPNVPLTFFLHELKQLPGNLNEYVLKPLFSFAGQGVVIDVSPADIEGIRDPWNWILQRKVNYASIIQTPGEPAKAEIRIMYLWPEGAARPEPVINLARLSKGKMIGTRYNKDHDWVGGTVAFFEP